MAGRIDDALSWLAGQRGAMEALLERLVSVNSFTENRAGVQAVANLVAGQLRTLGLAARRRASGRTCSSADRRMARRSSSSATPTRSSPRGRSRASGARAAARSVRAPST
jgi:hypothetical protein